MPAPATINWAVPEKMRDKFMLFRKKTGIVPNVTLNVTVQFPTKLSHPLIQEKISL